MSKTSCPIFFVSGLNDNKPVVEFKAAEAEAETEDRRQKAKAKPKAKGKSKNRKQKEKGANRGKAID